MLKASRFYAACALGVLFFTSTAIAQSHPKACAANLSACQDKGCSKPDKLPPDPDLNVKKNRVGHPDSLKRFTFSQFSALNNKAVNKKHRDQWTATENKKVSAVEDGAGAVLVGYLYDATLSDPETCNCYLPGEDGRDYHIWISQNTTPAKGEFIVVEMTPRVRQQMQGWTLAKLQSLKKQKAKVRVTGFITFDNEHYNFPEQGIRTTAWEIHPVTRFEVCPPNKNCSATSDAQWIDIQNTN